MSKRRSKSSGRWLQEHQDDAFVRQAAVDGFRSRAVYKLIEIDERDGLITPDARILELGAAPGGWTQYLAQRMGNGGEIIATDILPMDALASTRFVQGDFTEEAVAEELQGLIGTRGVDLVLSDMAPNLSGVASSDQARSMALVELALDMARQVLVPGGQFLVKVFQGSGYDSFMRDLKADFGSVKTRKPAASRPRSREVYVLASKLL